MTKTIKNLIKKNFVLMTPETPVQKLRTKLDDYILVNKGKVVAVLDFFALINNKIIDGDMNLDTFTIPVPVLDEDSEVMDALNFLIESGINYVPVAEGKKIVGIVDLLTLFKNCWKDLDTKSKINMKKLMLDDIYVDSKDSLSKVINIMKKHKIYVVPVTENDNFVGVCRLHDVLRAILVSKFSKKEKGSKSRGSSKRSTNTSERTQGINHLPIKNFLSPSEFITEYDTSSVIKRFLNSKKSNYESKYAIIKGKTISIIPLRHFISMLLSSSKKVDWRLSLYGLNRYDLNEFQQLNIKKKIEFFCSSLSREIKETFNIKISFKQYSKSVDKKKKNKWVITAMLVTSHGKYEAKEDNWKLDLCLVKVLKDIKDQFNKHQNKMRKVYRVSTKV